MRINNVPINIRHSILPAYFVLSVRADTHAEFKDFINLAGIDVCELPVYYRQRSRWQAEGYTEYRIHEDHRVTISLEYGI